MRTPAVLAVLLVLLLGGTLAGCGGDGYCGQLREAAPQLRAATGGGGGLAHTLPTLRDLQAGAPADLQDEWQVLVNAVAGFVATARRAHLDLSRPAAGQLDSLDPAVRGDVKAAAAKLRSAEVLDAATGIEKQASDVCSVELGG